MSGGPLAGFLFGNIDESGRLDDEDLDEELKNELTAFAKGGQADALLGLDQLDIEDNVVEEVEMDDGKIEEENLMEADKPLLEEKLEQKQFIPSPQPFKSPPLQSSRMPLLDIKRIYPGGPLKFTEMLGMQAGIAFPFATYEGESIKKPSLFYRLRKFRIRSHLRTPRLPAFAENQINLFKRQGTLFSTVPSRKNQLIIGKLTMSVPMKRLAPRLVNLQKIFETRKLKGGYEPSQLGRNIESVEIDDRTFHPLAITNWEKQITWDDESKITERMENIKPMYIDISGGTIFKNSGSTSSAPMSISNLTSVSRPTSAQGSRPSSGASTPHYIQAQTLPPRLKNPFNHAARILNFEFASCTWLDSVIWDDVQLPKRLPQTNLQLNMNDPYLLFETTESESFAKRLDHASRVIAKRLRKLRRSGNLGTTATSNGSIAASGNEVRISYGKPIKDKFNLSHDKYYENLPVKTLAKKGGALPPPPPIRASGDLTRTGLQHSVPALKLQAPFFHTFMNKTELRAFHRPKLSFFKEELPVKFIKSKPGNLSKRKNKAFLGTVIRSGKKLTLRDTSPIVMIEYSEEAPPLMMNTGMATHFFMYYRKVVTKDPNVPDNAELGAVAVLEPNDPSPFWMFGEVKAGEKQVAIVNNLYRAPLFAHEPSSSDFLAIRYHGKGSTTARHYLRELPMTIWIAGQTFPTTEVFGPHSRKCNTFSRKRVQLAAYRLFAKDPSSIERRRRLRISKLTMAFPQFSEGSLRKWLKDYAESLRHGGKDNGDNGNVSGVWEQKQEAPALSEEELRALVTPEAACVYEAMLAGQQRLLDTGILTGAGSDAEETDDNTTEDGIEGDSRKEETTHRLAPWTLTSNFVQAIAGRCTLELIGTGDPTGCGKGYSFVKVPQRTLQALRAAPESPSKEASGRRPTILGKFTATDQQAQYRKEALRIWEAQKTALSNTHPEIDADRMISTEDDNKISIPGQMANLSSQKRLVITRIEIDSKGESVTTSETLTDPRLISAYLKQRKIEETLRIRRLKLERRKASRPHYERPKKTKPERPPRIPRPPPAPKKDLSIRCSACGQIGHMKTNRYCPRYEDYVKQQEAAEKPLEGLKVEEGKVKVEGSRISISKDVLQKFIEHRESMLMISGRSEAFSSKKTSTTWIPEDFRKKPLNELSTILEEIIVKLIREPNSYPFNRPVSRKKYPYYYSLITNPRDLGTLRVWASQLRYSRAEEFLMDIELMADNCAKFNGDQHPFTIYARELVDKSKEMVGERKEEIQRLENEIHGEHYEGDDNASASGMFKEDPLASGEANAPMPIKIALRLPMRTLTTQAHEGTREESEVDIEETEESTHDSTKESLFTPVVYEDIFDPNNNRNI